MLKLIKIMKFIIIIMFLITVVRAKHIKSDIKSILDTNDNFFHTINGHFQNILNVTFKVLKYNFTDISKLRMYINMHYDLTIMSESNYEYFIDMKKICKPTSHNTAIKRFLNLSKVMEVIQEIMAKEIRKQPDSRIENYTDNKIFTDTDYARNFPDYKYVPSDFENSQELAAFANEFIKKINKLNVEDLYKRTSNRSDEIEETFLTKRNLKVWRPKKNPILFNSTRRLYEAKHTKIKLYPFMASVHLMSEFMCAASIISKDLVITAASCLQLIYNNRFYRENLKSLFVRVGSDFAMRGGEVVRAQEVYFCPAYNPETLNHNLVIVRLERQLKLIAKKRSVRRIELDTHEGIMPSNVGNILTLGWGAKNKRNIPDFMPKLSLASLDIYLLDECKLIYSKLYVTDRHFCAGFVSRGGGACNKDVGAPGVVGGRLSGVVSFGAPVCGTLDAPTVFTRVGNYINWIEEIMEMTPPIIKIRTTLAVPMKPPSFPASNPTVTIVERIGPMLRNASTISEEDTQLRQMLRDVITPNKNILDLLLYDEPDWANEDLSDTLKTTQKLKITQQSSAIPILYDIFAESEDPDEDIFATTKKEYVLENPLINQSIIFIPEKYGIHQTTEDPLPPRLTTWTPKWQATSAPTKPPLYPEQDKEQEETTHSYLPLRNKIYNHKKDYNNEDNSEKETKLSDDETESDGGQIKRNENQRTTYRESNIVKNGRLPNRNYKYTPEDNENGNYLTRDSSES